MSPDKLAILSLASDLKRISSFIKSSSFKNVGTFTKEAQRWLMESKKTANPSVQNLLAKVEKTLKEEDNLDKAEDLLMYSTLLQNRSLKNDIA